MKRSILLLVLLLETILILAQNNLEIRIDKIKNNEGDILVGLYNEDKNFPRNVSDGRIAKASKDGVTVIFLNIKPGAYAVSALHDENQNKDMDQNKLGIPKEGFGFSNNARGTLGPPSFKKAHIELHNDTKDTTIFINMKYILKKK